MSTPYTENTCRNTLRVNRKHLGLRQVDVADIMGCEAVDRISHWEKGKAVPGLINLLRLCVIYDVSLPQLYPELYLQIKREISASKNGNFTKSRM